MQSTRKLEEPFVIDVAKDNAKQKSIQRLPNFWKKECAQP